MSTTSEAPARLTIYDVPPPDQKPGWRERALKYGHGVKKVVQFTAELEANLTQEQLDGLAYHDDEASEEAYGTGELTDYEAGEPDENGIADSSCLWKNKEAAAAATHRPKHLRSTRYATNEKVYQNFIIREYDAEPDDDLILRLTLVRLMTKAQIERHIRTADKHKKELNKERPSRDVL